MKDYLRSLALAAGLFIPSPASALEVELVGKTTTPWTPEQENTLVVYGFGIEAHRYRIRLSDADVARAAQDKIRFMDDITQRIDDVEKRQEEKPALRFPSKTIRRILRQYPAFQGAKLQPGSYDITLKRRYGWGLWVTT